MFAGKSRKFFLTSHDVLGKAIRLRETESRETLLSISKDLGFPSVIAFECQSHEEHLQSNTKVTRSMLPKWCFLQQHSNMANRVQEPTLQISFDGKCINTKLLCNKTFLISVGSHGLKVSEDAIFRCALLNALAPPLTTCGEFIIPQRPQSHGIDLRSEW